MLCWNWNERVNLVSMILSFDFLLFSVNVGFLIGNCESGQVSFLLWLLLPSFWLKLGQFFVKIADSDYLLDFVDALFVQDFALHWDELISGNFSQTVNDFVLVQFLFEYQMTFLCVLDYTIVEQMIDMLSFWFHNFKSHYYFVQEGHKQVKGEGINLFACCRFSLKLFNQLKNWLFADTVVY